MSLQLYRTYTAEEAIAGFGHGPNMLCDDQFAILPEVVLCFFTMGETKDEPHLRRSTEVVWIPGRLDYVPAKQYPWLPTSVREVYEYDGDERIQKRRHHLFLRTKDCNEYIYAGEAHLGRYGNSGDLYSAVFYLKAALPREIWLQLGGYHGWSVCLNHVESIVAENDPTAFDRLLGELTAKDYSHLTLTRYEDDSLQIFTNSNSAWIMYLREPDDSGLYLNDPTRGDSEENFRCDCGIDLDFPVRQTTTHENAKQIVRHYFNAGYLPPDIQWEET